MEDSLFGEEEINGYEEEKIGSMLLSLTKELGLADDELALEPNYGRSGNLTSYSINIIEKEYPGYVDTSCKKTRTPVVNLKFSPKSEVRISGSLARAVNLPQGVKIRKGKEKNPSVTLSFTCCDDMLLDLLKDCVKARLKKYRSSSGDFGCCSRFAVCREKKQCVHPNRLYATGCEYRKIVEES